MKFSTSQKKSSRSQSKQGGDGLLGKEMLRYLVTFGTKSKEPQFSPQLPLRPTPRFW